MVLNNGSAALIAQTDSEGVLRSEAAGSLVDETKTDITVAVAESPTVDTSPDQSSDAPTTGQGDLLSLVVAVIAPCPARPSQLSGFVPTGLERHEIEGVPP